MEPWFINIKAILMDCRETSAKKKEWNQMDCLIPQQTKNISAWCILKIDRIIYELCNGFTKLFHFFMMLLQHLKIKLIPLSRLNRLCPCQLDVFVFPRKKCFANLEDDNSRNARDSFLKVSFGRTRVLSFLAIAELPVEEIHKHLSRLHPSLMH